MSSVLEAIKIMFTRQTRREAHADAVAAVTSDKKAEARNAINELLLELTTTSKERPEDDKGNIR